MSTGIATADINSVLMQAPPPTQHLMLQRNNAFNLLIIVKARDYRTMDDPERSELTFDDPGERYHLFFWWLQVETIHIIFIKVWRHFMDQGRQMGTQLCPSR